MKRRNFIKTGIIGGSMLSLSSLLECSSSRQFHPLPKRELGRTGEKLSIIGFGGILVMNEEQQNANDAVAMAIDRGVNYFDVAPSYGNAEIKLGPALKPWRDKSFLACKTTERDRAGSAKELEQSLINMKTDHFDLYQLHALTTIEDVETAFGANGAMETFIKARDEGKVRFLGFSAHSEEAALLAMNKFDFDTILFPINFAAWLTAGFGPATIAKAREKQMGILALKGLAYGRIKEGQENPYDKCWYHPIALEDNQLANMALRFTLAQNITAVIPPGEPVFFPRALEIAGNATEITPDEIHQLEQAGANVEPIFSRA